LEMYIPRYILTIVVRHAALLGAMYIKLKRGLRGKEGTPGLAESRGYFLFRYLC